MLKQPLELPLLFSFSSASPCLMATASNTECFNKGSRRALQFPHGLCRGKHHSPQIPSPSNMVHGYSITRLPHSTQALAPTIPVPTSVMLLFPFSAQLLPLSTSDLGGKNQNKPKTMFPDEKNEINKSIDLSRHH